MKKIHTLTESDLERIVKTVLENFNPSEYEDEDFIEVFLNYFRPWVKKTHGDEVGQYPLSLLIKNHINGSGYEDGRILITAHGFMSAKEDSEEKKSIEDYKKEQGDYIGKMLGVNVTDISDVEVVTEESDL